MSEWDQRKGSRGSSPQSDAEPEAGENTVRDRARLRRALLRKNGDDSEKAEPLNPALRQKAEGSLGTPLAAVRVHSGRESQQANAEMGSKAFAVGNDIVLGASVENSANPILAHEVAHTVQQQGATPVVAPKLERDGWLSQEISMAHPRS